MPLTQSEAINQAHRLLIADLEQSGVKFSDLNQEFLLSRLKSLISQPEIMRRVVDRVLGFGPLEPLLADPSITEIMVNGLQSVYVEKQGKLLKQDIHFTSEEEILQVISRIVSSVGRRIDESSPLVDARLPDGSRVNAIISPLSRVGPVLTIRRFPNEPFTLERLINTKALSVEMADFLAGAVSSKQNIIISGSTGSGKTSTLNALAATVSPAERLVSIEDTAEIRLNHPHLVQLEARQPNLEGSGEVTIRTLLKNVLRMRPDRIIIGEVRGGEALDMLQAMNTGHPGSLTTIHANSPDEALSRLETMTLMADVELPLPAIREQIKSAVHYLVQQERLPNGERKIVAISKMESKANQAEGSKYLVSPLFIFDKQENKFIKI